MIGFLSTLNIPGLAPVNFGWLALAGGLLFIRPTRPTMVHWLILAFLIYCALTLYWSPDPVHGQIKLAQYALIAVAFYYGLSCENIDHIYIGAAIGTAISIPIVAMQLLGWEVLPWFSTYPGGMFGNSATFGQVCALLLVPMLILCRALLSLVLFSGILLSGSRGAWLILLVVTLASRSYLIAVLPLVGLGIASWLYRPEDYRMHMWAEIIRTFVPQGHGLGSFSFNDYGNFFLHAHNDLLELASEVGLGVVPLLAAGWLVLRAKGDEVARYTLIAFCTLAMFAFPTYVPVSALILGVTAGQLTRREAHDWRSSPLAAPRPALPERAWD